MLLGCANDGFVVHAVGKMHRRKECFLFMVLEVWLPRKNMTLFVSETAAARDSV